MIIYGGAKSKFLDDVLDGDIDNKLKDNLKEKMGITVSKNEARSWINSLKHMHAVLSTSDIPDDVGVSLEYNIPHSSKRIDMILTGRDELKNHIAVVIELKQWEKGEEVIDQDGIVRTYLGGNERTTTHPSCQVWDYVRSIERYNAAVQDERIGLHPCVCLHNYEICDNDPLKNDIYVKYYSLAPIFGKHDSKKLREFIKQYIKVGDPELQTMYYIENGKIRPSKSLQDELIAMLEGNESFIMIDEQKVIYEEILNRAKFIEEKDGKEVMIIEGGPGTGKSVLAINLLVKLTENSKSVSYVTKNSAPRNVYSAKLKGYKTKNYIDNMFKSSGSFCNTTSEDFDILLVDESHRLNEKSGLFSKGENQIMEIIRASKLSVFFIDEDQRVTAKDIGTIDEIKKHAENAGAKISTMKLESQFRCDGSDGYVAWLDNVLELRNTANYDAPSNYVFKVFDDPCEMRAAIEEKNGNNKSRMVAGYCWNWISKDVGSFDEMDVTIPEYGFGMQWNLNTTSTWSIDEGSIEQIGCIHTCQGLEFDYVGVIIGDDLRFENGKVITDQTKRAKTDKSLYGLGSRYPDPIERAEIADKIIRNTYKVLMTRGMKGCFVYCTDKELANYLKRRSPSFKEI